MQDEERRQPQNEPPPAEEEQQAQHAGQAVPPPQTGDSWTTGGSSGYAGTPLSSNKITVQGLVEGAVMTGVAVVLSMLSLLLPITQLVATFLFPVPVAFLVLRRGLKLGLICTVSTFLLNSIFFGPAVALTLVMLLGGVGLFMGWCFRKQKSALFTLGGNAVLAATGTVGELVLTVYLTGLPYAALLEEVVNTMLESFAASGNAEIFYGGMTAAQYNEFVTTTVQSMMPAFMVAWSMLMAVICYLVFSKFVKRLGYLTKGLPRFAEWRISWGFLWLLIVAMGSSGLGERFAIDWLATLGGNLLYICAPIFFTFGVSVLTWLFQRWRAGVIFKILLIYLLISMFGFSFYLIMFLGVFDPIIDFRGRWQRLAKSRDS